MNDNFKVPLTTILDILPHPNPKVERLEVAKVYDYFVVIRKAQYKIGDSVYYAPIDSVLPAWLEEQLFPKEAKIKLHKSRIKQIKIQGFYSQGMLINPEDISDTRFPHVIQLEEDVSEYLEIKKYEPPTPSFQQSNGPKLRNKPYSNSYFRCFNGITNIKWAPYAFKDEEVVIQCKIHGSHVRFGKAPFAANTIWKKVLKFLNLAPQFENVWGSNNVELTNRTRKKSFYGGDIYYDVIKKQKGFEKIKDGEFVHGEVVGPGIQKGYTYGHTEHHMVIFDVRILQEDGTQKWLNPEEAEAFAKERGFTFVPVLYKGIFSKEIVEEHTKGPSVYCPKERIREGCVIKSRYFYNDNGNKRAFKSINPDYLNTDPSDNH